MSALAAPRATLHPIELDSLRTVGCDLARPECVLCNAHGDIYTADWRGGVMQISPEGTQTLFSRPCPRRPRAQAQRHCLACRWLVSGC